MRIRVFIEDGIIESVQADSKANKLAEKDLDLEIVNYDSDIDSQEKLSDLMSEPDMYNISRYIQIPCNHMEETVVHTSQPNEPRSIIFDASGKIRNDLTTDTSETINVSELLSHCDEVADTLHKLSEKAIKSTGLGETDTSSLGAAAYFAQQEKIFRYEIPSIIHELLSIKKGKNND